MAMNMHTPVSTGTLATTEFEARAAKRRRLAVAAAVVAAVLGGLLLLLGRGSSQPAAQAQQLATVTVLVPGQTSVADDIRVTGMVAARREMPVGVQGEGGMVTSVLVDAGDYVRAGQVLARIDRSVQAQQVRQLEASLRQTRADALLAQAELDRARALVARGFISKADIDRRTATRDSANARVAVAAAQLRESQARLARLDVRAPDDGLVLSRAVEAGQVVSSGGEPLFRIAQDGAMEMKARVAEQDLPKLKVGFPVAAQLVGSSRSFDGEIWLLEPVIDPQSRQGMARILLKRDPDLRVGAFANARIAAGTTTRPVLPQTAILADDKGSYVLVVDAGNKVVRRDVTIGGVSSKGIAVASGLSGTERIVATAGAFLRPGEKVKPVLAKAEG